MRFSFEKMISLMAITLLSACAAQEKPTEAFQISPQEEKKAVELFCKQKMPKASKQKILECMADKEEVTSQIMLANQYLTKNRTSERCQKGAELLEKAAAQKDKFALAQLAEVYQGERMYKTGDDITHCTRNGKIKKDPVKAYGYLLAAQNVYEERRRTNPNKPACKPDYVLQLESWGDKLSPTQKTNAALIAWQYSPKPETGTKTKKVWNEPKKVWNQ